jgi:hypothetical protein
MTPEIIRRHVYGFFFTGEIFNVSVCSLLTTPEELKTWIKTDHDFFPKNRGLNLNVYLTMLEPLVEHILKFVSSLQYVIFHDAEICIP